jgi:hypothetical protein
MPATPNECRERAKRCLEIAYSATNPRLKQSLETIAQTWMRLATELGSTERLLEAWGDPRPVLDKHPGVPFRPRMI